MNTIFSVFKFHNDAGIKAHFVLESPAGTKICQGDVDPGGDSDVLPFSVSNAIQVKLTVSTDEDHPQETRMFDVTNVSSIGASYITELTVSYSLGTINGTIALAFDASD